MGHRVSVRECVCVRAGTRMRVCPCEKERVSKNVKKSVLMGLMFV